MSRWLAAEGHDDILAAGVAHFPADSAMDPFAQMHGKGTVKSMIAAVFG
jgi:hypothetical protein